MPRARGGYKTRRRRKKILARAKGFYGRRNRTFKAAKETVHRARQYEYRDRRRKKREMRSLWIIRINAGARAHHLTYGQLMNGLRKTGVTMDRKILADLAAHDQAGFARIVGEVKQALNLPAGDRPGAAPQG